jgi:hypothetical protein
VGWNQFSFYSLHNHTISFSTSPDASRRLFVAHHMAVAMSAPGPPHPRVEAYMLSEPVIDSVISVYRVNHSLLFEWTNCADVKVEELLLRHSPTT